MNNFPAMTEEQRQELITACKADISCARTLMLAAMNIRDGVATAKWESQLRRQEIALAALTAEPEVWIKPDSLGFPRLAGIDAVTIPYVPEYPIPLYTAPPAPVLRLPGEVSCEGLDPQEADEARNLGQCEGWNQCLAEIKSLNNQPAPPETSNEQ